MSRPCRFCVDMLTPNSRFDRLHGGLRPRCEGQTEEVPVYQNRRRSTISCIEALSTKNRLRCADVAHVAHVAGKSFVSSSTHMWDLGFRSRVEPWKSEQCVDSLLDYVRKALQLQAAMTSGMMPFQPISIHFILKSEIMPLRHCETPGVHPCQLEAWRPGQKTNVTLTLTLTSISSIDFGWRSRHI